MASIKGCGCSLKYFDIDVPGTDSRYQVYLLSLLPLVLIRGMQMNSSSIRGGVSKYNTDLLHL